MTSGEVNQARVSPEPPLSAGAVPELPKLYSDRDSFALDKAGGYHMRHRMAMTAEGLHSKGDIADELGWRDQQIDAAQAIIDAQAAEIEHHKQVAEAWKISYLQIRSEIIALKAAQVAEVDAVLQAGNPMSNVMFNLAQRPNERITSAECKTFKKLQVKWDAASEALRAALTKDRT